MAVICGRHPVPNWINRQESHAIDSNVMTFKWQIVPDINGIISRVHCKSQFDELPIAFPIWQASQVIFSLGATFPQIGWKKKSLVISYSDVSGCAPSSSFTGMRQVTEEGRTLRVILISLILRLPPHLSAISKIDLVKLWKMAPRGLSFNPRTSINYREQKERNLSV